MDKAYQPAAIEQTLVPAVGSAGYFAPVRPWCALLHHDPAAERHRHPAHGTCLPAHAAGRPDPLSPHGRRQHAVAAGHRSRRHRHADGGRAPAECRGHRPARISAARHSSSASGSGSRNPAAPSRARCAAWATRWTGRATASRWTPALSQAVTEVFVRLYRRRPDLPRQAAGQLGSRAAHRALGPGSPVGSRSRARSGTSAIRSRTARATWSWPPPDPKPCWAILRSPCIPTMSATAPDRQAVHLPLTGRLIPVIADDYVDREFGSGCVKITPGMTSTTTRSASGTPCH